MMECVPRTSQPLPKLAMETEPPPDSRAALHIVNTWGQHNQFIKSSYVPGSITVAEELLYVEQTAHQRSSARVLLNWF